MKLFNHKLNQNRTLYILLTQIYGVNRQLSQRICRTLGFGTKFKGRDLSKKQFKLLTKFFADNSTILFEIKLKKFETKSIDKLIKIKSYKGFRHKYGLPVNGQNTH